MQALNKKEVVALKGLAIAMIVFHNFFHIIFKKTKENEADFDAQRFLYFFNDFIYSPQEWVQALFTYFGHFGVQIFIFLSAYALVYAYPAGGKAFFISRIKKLYPTFIAAILLLMIPASTALLFMSVENPVPMLAYLLDELLDVVYLLLGFYPFIPGNLYPIVGPWWFIAFIIQFYFLWSICGRRLCTLDEKGLVVLGLGLFLASLFFIPWVMKAWDVNLLLTVFGHFPEIIFAVYVARFGFPLPQLMLFMATILLGLSGLYLPFYPFHHFSALIVFLSLTLFIVRHLGVRGQQVVSWLGRYSLTLFLVNGFLREVFVFIAGHFKLWWVDMACAIAFFAVACAIAYGLQKMVNRYSSKRVIST